MRSSVRLGLFIGNILHHYDTSLFGWIAPFLAPILFPQKSPSQALLLTFAFLPLSYLIRPVGAFFWGWLGDRFGRKPVVTTAIAGVALSTFAIGCLPLTDYAWVLLALFRLLQGFFAAGEEKGAALFLLENTPPGPKRAWASALYDATGIIGIFLASLLVAGWGETQWRPLFWFGSAAGLLAIFLRKKAEESPEHIPTRSSWKTLWQEKLPLLRIALVSGFSYANYFLLSVFLNGFLPQITTLTKKQMLTFNTHLLWLDSLLLLAFGLACRWVKKEHLMATAALLAATCAIPLFLCLEGADFLTAALVRISLMIFGVALAAPYHAWKLEILPLKHRFLIGSTGSALGAKLFGAPIPLLSTWLVMHTGWIWAAALPIVFLGLIAGIVILLELQSRESAIYTNEGIT